MLFKSAKQCNVMHGNTETTTCCGSSPIPKIRPYIHVPENTFSWQKDRQSQFECIVLHITTVHSRVGRAQLHQTRNRSLQDCNLPEENNFYHMQWWGLGSFQTLTVKQERPVRNKTTKWKQAQWKCELNGFFFSQIFSVAFNDVSTTLFY